MVKIELQKLLERVVHELVVLEHPENPEHGDYSTNIALVLAQKLGKTPREIAESILSKVKSQKSKVIEKVEVAGPGFINFFLAKDFLVQELSHIAKQKEKYGSALRPRAKSRSSGQGKQKIIVEFTDPNPFKEFHIGHLYSNTVGESLCRLFEARGALVKRANYQGDVGMHVAKAILGMKLLADEMPKEKASLLEKVQWLGRCYALGSAAGVELDELERINKAAYEKSDEALNKLYGIGRKWSLEYFENIYKRLGTKFDQYYFESKVGNTGMKIVEEGLKKGVFERSEGAVIFPGEKYGLHSRVFINSQGLPTYEAKELGLAPTKYKDFKYDLSIIVTGNEITDYFKVILAAMKQMYPELGEKTRHISHGMVRLPEGKMSSRTGNIITAEDLLDEVKLRVLNVMETSTSVLSKKDREKTAEMVAVGAVKYSLLRTSLGKDIAFDFEKSLNLEGDSGPYLQYTYARCKSILRKSTRSFDRVPSRMTGQIRNVSKEELDILRILYRFPEIVREAAEKFSPNLVANFIFDLAQKYNLFYNTHRVLDAETKQARDFRLLLTAAVAQIIKNSLSLLGIAAPERM